MIRLILFLTCLTFMADCRLLSRRYSSCDSTVLCVLPVAQVGSGADVDLLTDEQMLDNFCSEATSVATCVGQERSSCHDESVLAEVDGLVTISEYICSQEGRQDVLKLSSSPCANDDQLLTQVELLLEGCVETLTFQIQMMMLTSMSSGNQVQTENICPFLYEFVSCSANGVSVKCGEDFGEFIRKIVKMAGDQQFTNLGCSTSNIRSARHMIEQALPLLGRALVKRR